MRFIIFRMYMCVYLFLETLCKSVNTSRVSTNLNCGGD
jgi:hypothetical protein